MAIDQDAIAAALAAAQRFRIWKAALALESTGAFGSLWKVAGIPVASTLTPGLGGTVPTRATVGALGQANASGANNLYALQAVLSGSLAVSVIFADRKWANSAMSGIVTTTDTTLGATADVDRPDGSTPNEMWIEVNSAFGSTGATLSVEYTAIDGTANRHATLVHPVGGASGAPAAGMMFPMTLEGTDQGVRRPTAYHWSISTGTAGDFGVVVLERKVEMPIPQAGVPTLLDWADLGLANFPDDECIMMIAQGNTANSGTLAGRFAIGEMTP